MTTRTAHVLYDFTASSSEELTLKTGQKINVLKVSDDGIWVTAEANGKKGSIPRAWILFDDDITPSAPPAYEDVVQATEEKENAAFLLEHVVDKLPIDKRVEVASKLTNNGFTRELLEDASFEITASVLMDAGIDKAAYRQLIIQAVGRLRQNVGGVQEANRHGSPLAGEPASAGKMKARALFDYTATEENELSFEEGDVVTIHKMDDSGWWEARPFSNYRCSAYLLS